MGVIPQLHVILFLLFASAHRTFIRENTVYFIRGMDI